MWKQLDEAIKQLVLLTHQTERNREDIKQLGQQVRELAHALERLAYEVHRVNERVDYGSNNEAQEREKLALRLENELLKFERRLPSGTRAKRTISKHTKTLFLPVFDSASSGKEESETLSAGFDPSTDQEREERGGHKL